MVPEVLISEVGPRDGLQSVAATMPTAAKLRWIDALHASGLREIEVCAEGRTEIDGKCLAHLEVEAVGTQTAQQFDETVRDITAFLQYAAEPAALQRQKLGAWVVLYLAFFTFLAWLLKKEYWKDVH